MSGLISQDCSGSGNTLGSPYFQTYELSLRQKQKAGSGIQVSLPINY